MDSYPHEKIALDVNLIKCYWNKSSAIMCIINEVSYEVYKERIESVNKYKIQLF